MHYNAHRGMSVLGEEQWLHGEYSRENIETLNLTEKNYVEIKLTELDLPWKESDSSCKSSQSVFRYSSSNLVNCAYEIEPVKEKQKPYWSFFIFNGQKLCS